MISYILAIWIAGSIIFAGIYAIALWRLGGWQGAVDYFHMIGDVKTSIVEVQWLLVGITLLWPIVIGLLFAFRRIK